MLLQEEQPSDFSPVHMNFPDSLAGQSLIALLYVVSFFSTDAPKICIIIESCIIFCHFFVKKGKKVHAECKNTPIFLLGRYISLPIFRKTFLGEIAYKQEKRKQISCSRLLLYIFSYVISVYRHVGFKIR